MDCGSATLNQAQAELAYPEKRYHRDAVYEACSFMSETQVDLFIQKTIGELAEHEGNPG
ncbi:hypothetical protein AB0K74_47665 [Streptomyces sp. NPDC056159]|uniref:hypothetical protein n=1 Tax=unclassified Streptomyces TaxID=2593676 RepID=UPI00341313EF